jgi:hypothetical protein
MGEAARERVRESFLAASRLVEYAELLFDLDARDGS